MLRRIISIDREKCNGCGLCAKACHEGAIGMVDGKAQLLREDYCDGLGDCLPAPFRRFRVATEKDRHPKMTAFPFEVLKKRVYSFLAFFLASASFTLLTTRPVRANRARALGMTMR